jgi:hypothetical protein
LRRANKREGESVEQAYTRLAETTESGSLLLKAAIWAPKPKQAPQDLVPRKKPEPLGPAAREMQAIAEEMARAKGISSDRAVGRIMQDPGRQELVRRLLAEEQAATREVRAQRWPMPEKV